MIVQNLEYECTMGSDVRHRDGMYLELNRAGREHEGPLAEVFYSDVDGSMVFSSYAADLPLEVIEWFIAEGRKQLPPINPSSNEASSRPPS